MRGAVRIGRSIYGVVVINGSLCSRVYGMYACRVCHVHSTIKIARSACMHVLCMHACGSSVEAGQTESRLEVERPTWLVGPTFGWG